MARWIPVSVDSLGETRPPLSLRAVMPDAPGLVQGDERRVEQVLKNLLGNALKFTEKGGVTISLVDDPQGLLRIEVSDTGIGIAADAMEVLFQPFMQIDSRLSRQHEGTGLGLAISRRLAELMGGTVDARSEAGKGSVFSLVLPR